MDKLTGVENLLSQILLNGDTDRFINELKMLNVSVDEAREMEPFAEPALGQLVATVIEKLGKQESVSNVLNELYSKVKTCTKLFSAIGLDGYSEANNVDTKDPDVVNTIEKELVTPVNKDTITEIATDGKLASPVDVNAKEFSVGDEVVIDGEIKSDDTHKVVGKIEDGTIILDNGMKVTNPEVLKKVEGDLTVTKPKDVPGMNGLVDGIGESTPSTEGNGGCVIEKGVNMSEMNFDALDRARKRLAKAELKSEASKLDIIRKAGLAGASDKDKVKAINRENKFRRAKNEMKQLKKYGDIRSRVIAARVGGIADAVGNISGSINENLPAVANVLKTTANTIRDTKHDVAPNLTLENTKKLLESKNGNIDETVKELEKKNGVELNSSVHDEWMKVAELCKNYSAILEDESIYYRLFSGDELTSGDVVTFSGKDYLVTGSLNNGDTSAISTVDLLTGDSAMFNVSNNELYESTDFFDFDEGKFVSDEGETVPVVSTNENKDSDEKYVVVIDKSAKEVTTNGPMSEADADKLCIKTEGTPDTTVLKVGDAVEAGKVAEQANHALKVGSLENAGISVARKADEVSASDVSVGDVTNVETGKGKEEVLIEDKKEGVGGTTTFSATVLDSTNTDDIGRTIEFTVDNDTCFSISDFYMEEEGCYFSDIDETSSENKDDTCPECGNNPCTCEEDKMTDEVKVLDKPAEVAAAELKEGDVTSIVDNEGNKSDVLVNETRSDGNGNTVVEATVLSSELFSEGEVFMFSAMDGELFSVSANTENDFNGFNFSESGEFWIVAQPKNATECDRKKLGPYTKDELKENFEGLQEAGYKVWKFDSESEADKKVVGKLTTADKIKIGAGVTAGIAGSVGAGLAATKLVNKNHSEECEECGKLEAKEVEAGDVVECVKDGKPTAVLITEKVEDKDGSVKFSAVTLDDNVVDSNTDVTFSALADAEFGYYGTYDFSDETECEVKPEERLEEIKEEGNVAKTVDEVKPGDVAKVDDTEIVVTEVKPTEDGIKVEGKVVEDKSGNFSVADDVSMVIDADYIFSISDFYDFESNTFFSEKYFSQDITPTEAPAVEIVEKKEVTTAPVDTTECPVTQLMGEPKTEVTETEPEAKTEDKEEVKSCQNNFSAISIEDKLAYLHSI